MDCSLPGFPVHHQFLELAKLMSFELLMPSNHLIFCHPLLLLPSVFPSIRVFSNVSSSHQMAKVLDVQLYHQSFQWIFRTDFLQDGLFESPCSPRDSQEFSPIPQFKSISSSVVTFHYGPTLTSIADYWKTIALTRQTLVSKIMSLVFNMLSRLVIAFLPRSKQLLISWLQSPSAVILQPKKIKSVTVSVVSHLLAIKWNQMPWNSFFECWVLSQLFHSLLSLSSRGSALTMC